MVSLSRDKKQEFHCCCVFLSIKMKENNVVIWDGNDPIEKRKLVMECGLRGPEFPSKQESKGPHTWRVVHTWRA